MESVSERKTTAESAVNEEADVTPSYPFQDVELELTETILGEAMIPMFNPNTNSVEWTSQSVTIPEGTTIRAKMNIKV